MRTFTLAHHDRQVAIRSERSRLRISDTPPIRTADGKPLRSLTFFPPDGKGNWERVAYGEEGEYFLIFTLSARSLESYRASLPAFETLLAGYRELPDLAPSSKPR